jgi:hypothetical protein
VLRSRLVIERKEYSGDDLDTEKEKCHPAEIIPERVFVPGNSLGGEECGNLAERQPLKEPFSPTGKLHRRDEVIGIKHVSDI